MNIKVRVSRDRRCFASLDKVEEIPQAYWIMSFGDKNRPKTDVEIEFTSKQIRNLKDMLNEWYSKGELNVEHFGQC